MSKPIDRKRYLKNVLNIICSKISNYWVKNYHKRIERNGYHELVNLADRYAKELLSLEEPKSNNFKI